MTLLFNLVLETIEIVSRIDKVINYADDVALMARNMKVLEELARRTIKAVC